MDGNDKIVYGPENVFLPFGVDGITMKRSLEISVDRFTELIKQIWECKTRKFHTRTGLTYVTAPHDTIVGITGKRDLSVYNPLAGEGLHVLPANDGVQAGFLDFLRQRKGETIEDDGIVVVVFNAVDGDSPSPEFLMTVTSLGTPKSVIALYPYMMSKSDPLAVLRAS
ncbi:hypothetical protein HY463_00625 [Candidatus Peregrinibacteria bacterium]|nr:hypothetical protein [Candidatus Peregrinibacteria bacterium]